MAEDNSTENSKRVKKTAPTAKKTFSLDKFTEQFKGGFELNDKPLKWLTLADSFQKEVGLPGFPMGYVSLVRGYSNTGKSTAIMEAIIDAQKKGQFIVIIDTENNLGKTRLKLMGFDETNKNYLYVNNDFLLENYGKVRNPEIRSACI
jgi:predicted ATP-dependent serine protease